MNTTVNIDSLAKKYPLLDHHKFQKGHTYPLSELMKEIGLTKGTSQGKPRGNTK